MEDNETFNITMKVRFGEKELEVSGPKEFVEQKISEFTEKYGKISEYGRFSGIENLEEEENPVNVGKKQWSESQFFRKINPRTDVDRVLAAAYYLEIVRKIEKFTASEVKAVIKQAKIPPPKNPNESINNNIRKGFMMAAGDKDGKIAFVLTTDGEDAVATLLNQ